MQDQATAAGVPKDFVHRYLPWLVAGGALLLYLVTLNRWPVYFPLPALARVGGWDWRPPLYAPLHFLLTLPIQWLPGGWQLIALNLFSAVCSALSLALLARSVSLLPHDRTRDQRQLERNDYSLLSIRAAWLPPLLAVLVCGLQMSFWENAVFGTYEALDLLVFAYVLRCLLEYRIDQRDSWMLRAAFVYGLGMTNNVAMIAFFPAFLLAIVWIKGRTFFNWKFVGWMLACGVAGLLLYLLLPAVNSASHLSELSFGTALRTILGSQKTTLLGVPRYVILLIGLTSLLPVLFLGIRWPAQFGDISAAGTALTNLMTHVIHGVFLAACVYVAFDPPFSPRQLGRPFVFLPFYYLGALAIGYCSGYFLLVFGPPPIVKAWQRPSLLRRVLKYGVLGAVWAGAVAVPAGLIYRNLPQLRQANGRELSDFVAVASQQLPAQGAIVLSDDSFRLQALAAALARINPRHNHLLVDTSIVQAPAYQRWLHKKYPQRWPNPPGSPASTEPLDTATVANLLLKLSESGDLYYLQPSFGSYFEFFYLKPRKALYQLVPYPAGAVSAPLLTPTEIQENDAFWKQFRTEKLTRLIQAVKREQAKEKAKQKTNPLLLFTGLGFSCALDFFGVEMQRAGHLKPAGEYFSYALECNPDSPSAFINLDYNSLLQAGQTSNPEPSAGAKKRIAFYGGNWDNILSSCGPVDEPNSCFLLAQTLARGGNTRQAAQQLERVLHYNPASLNVEMSLAMTYVRANFPDKALELIARVRARSSTNALQVLDELTLLQAEAWAHARKNDLPTAERILQASQERYPQHATPFAGLAEIYIGLGQAAKAIPVLERQLQLQTNNVVALANLGALKMQAQQVDAALPLLDRCLALQPQNVYARLNRAIAHLQRDHLEEAQQDYEHLELNMTTPMREVYFGLGEIYARKKMIKKAMEQYEKYMKIAPPSTPEYNYVRDRLKVLNKGGGL